MTDKNKPPSRDLGRAEPFARAEHLTRAVQAQIIPQLLRGRQDTSDRTNGASRALSADGYQAKRLTGEDVGAFVNLLLRYEPVVALRYIESQVALGHSVSDLLLDVCAPAAKELGAMWVRDECSFCEVTIGLSTLEHILMHFSGPLEGLPTDNGNDRTLLLATMPGDQHIFGTLIVKEIFRKSGWIVRSPARSTRGSLLESLRTTRFSALGLSVASPDDLQACQALVKACRQESLNKRLLILVGGNGIAEPSLSTRSLDADLLVRDAREGLAQVERLLSHSSVARPFN